MSIEAMKAVKMVYANTTKHDWPDDIWDAICQAIESEVTDLDAICQDLQEMTYTQAMRIAELEAKLAEKQEPSGWVSQHTTKGVYEWQFNKELSGVYKDTAISILPVYTHPQPKREWVGLTPEEIDNIEFAGLATPKEKRELVRAIEAKLKEKNT